MPRQLTCIDCNAPLKNYTAIRCRSCAAIERGKNSRGKKRHSRPRRGAFVACESCGKKIYRSLWRLKRAKHYFCSVSCEMKFRVGELAPNWQGGIVPLHVKTKMKLTRKRYCQQVHIKLILRMRKRIWDALKLNYKSAHTLKLLGCSVEFFKLWLELQFKNGMSWDNYGIHGWHMDHIRPCISFDLELPEHQAACFHFTNIQPLWAKDNISKGGHYNNKNSEND